MENFSAAAYKKQLAAAASIRDCGKPLLRDLSKLGEYIFISYSHKDYKAVYADLADLYERGIPFWFDGGLPAGKSWSQEVLERMTDPKCCGVVFYLSEDLFLSQSVQSEIRTVLGKTGDYRTQLNHICINLTALRPSEILDRVFAKKQFTDTADRMQAKQEWVNNLAEAFPDQCTYLEFADGEHLRQLESNLESLFGIDIQKYRSSGGYPELPANTPLNGEGTKEYQDGSVYSGQWKDGKREGYGEMLWPSGFSYRGQWKNNKRHGAGITQWHSGDTHEGFWDQNRIHGPGRYTWKDGTVFEGHWLNGKRSGPGKLTWTSGKTQEAYWQEDQRVK